MEPPKIYLAGPEVFLSQARELGARKKAMCERYGFVGLFPFDNELEDLPPDGHKAQAIFQANVDLMRRADLLIANLTPFRGPSADVGTVFELGMMAGMGKPVLGYTNDSPHLLERVRRREPDVHFDAARRAWVDALDMSIEDFQCADNLMIEMSLRAAGAVMVRNDIPAADRFVDLRGFETCLQMARQSRLSAAAI